ncbi:MAG: glycosyltransferase [Akkermansia sp.]|nr:glycosyltransferase [Akkermansia sp.]
MKFYIVTPTFNALSWLQCCIRSVADQVGDGVEVHHHVQDGASTDGTTEWLAEWQQAHSGDAGYTFTYESAKDGGMYDAINKAWEKMPSDADVTAHLNSDEQYLPRALKGVAEAFGAHSEAEIVLGTYIIVDSDSRYICHRRPVKPARWRSQTVCEIITCSCFHKAEAFLRHGIRFDASYKALADLVFYRNIVNVATRFCVQPSLITSCFSVTGSNLAWSASSLSEWKAEMARLPWYVEMRHGVAYRYNNMLRRMCDLQHKAPDSYAIYTCQDLNRVKIAIQNPTSHWGMRTESHEKACFISKDRSE